jgi:hypothetical protein
MAPQPALKHLGAAPRQQIHRPVALKIDEDGAVGVATLASEVVDTQHSWGWTLLRFSQTDDAQDSVSAEWHPEPTAEPGSGPATEGQAQHLESQAQAHRALGVGGQELGQPLGEDPPGTAPILASEAPDVQDESDGILAD